MKKYYALMTKDRKLYRCHHNDLIVIDSHIQLQNTKGWICPIIRSVIVGEDDLHFIQRLDDQPMYISDCKLMKDSEVERKNIKCNMYSRAHQCFEFMTTLVTNCVLYNTRNVLEDKMYVTKVLGSDYFLENPSKIRLLPDEEWSLEIKIEFTHKKASAFANWLPAHDKTKERLWKIALAKESVNISYISPQTHDMVMYMLESAKANGKHINSKHYGNIDIVTDKQEGGYIKYFDEEIDCELIRQCPKYYRILQNDPNRINVTINRTLLEC